MAAGATLLAACGDDEPGAVAKDGSITVKHVFGETKIPGPPSRVVSAGLTGQDDLLALGVVPVAVTDWFGGEPFAVWPWAQPRLGGARPVVLNLNDGIQVDQITALKPDLIVATDAGLDADTYAELADIAPTIAQSGQEPFFEPWKDQAIAIGQAVFKFDEMTALIQGVDDRFAAVAKDNPAFAGKKLLLLGGAFEQDGIVAVAPGWRTDFVTESGFVNTDAVDRFTGAQRALIPRADLASVLDTADVLVWMTESDEAQAALLADPTVAQLRATREQRNVFTGKELAGAISFASPLSYPFVADQLPPRIAQVLS
jgi:iron complex transport system substrate-binding protein